MTLPHKSDTNFIIKLSHTDIPWAKRFNLVNLWTSFTHGCQEETNEKDKLSVHFTKCFFFNDKLSYYDHIGVVS